MTHRTRLTDVGITRLKPGSTDYTVWDTVTPGLGIRVRTSGFRGYVLHQRSRQVSLGPVALKGVQDARKECLAIQLDGIEAETGTGKKHGSGIPPFGDYVTDIWMAGHSDRWKPSTLKQVESLLRCQLLPSFGHLQLDRITPADVQAWFDRSSATSPGNANKALALIRRIMNHAVSNSLVDANPAQRTRMNPRPRLTRFLSAQEIARLHEALERCVEERPASSAQADIIRLLLFTGCRKSEVKDLRWSEVGEDTLRLADSKTGPRTVHLSANARAVIARQRRGTSPFVFPSTLNPRRPFGNDLMLWNHVRERAGLSGIRLHDLRHTYASQAVMKGIPLPVVARLLGHSEVRMTMRYAHVGDREVAAAAERIGQAISYALDGLD